MTPPPYPPEARAHSALPRRYSLRRGRAPSNEDLLNAAVGLLTLGLFLAALLLVLQGI